MLLGPVVWGRPGHFSSVERLEEYVTVSSRKKASVEKAFLGKAFLGKNCTKIAPVERLAVEERMS